MKLNVIDKSNYFKGLLLLVGKDKRISAEEKNWIKKVGKVLGFEKTFCEEAINNILYNKNIIDEPPAFSDKLFAQSFLKDGIKLAFADQEINKNEHIFLEQIAIKNNISPLWFRNELNNYSNRNNIFQKEINLEVQNHI
ncbi:MAG: hypothetical protein PVH88_23100 [Ignavibacteria bacterium]|jgi:hypothetical protein